MRDAEQGYVEAYEILDRTYEYGEVVERSKEQAAVQGDILSLDFIKIGEVKNEML